jgi:hypothetical protein
MLSKIMGNIITQVVIMVTIVAWIGWDIYAYLHFGNAATESATIFRWSYHAPGAAFLAGILCGHLFFPQHEVLDELQKKD